MSVSLRNSLWPQEGHAVCLGSRAEGSCLYQASAPSFLKSSTTLLLMALSLSGSPHFSQRKTAMGTPQMRWREIHQSGRVAIMLEMRSSPQAGSHTTCLISSRARWRKVAVEICGASDKMRGFFDSALRASLRMTSLEGLSIGVSMPMNHCSVARTMMGLWQRQQCG